MMCQAASKMAIKVMVLDPEENCPASSLSFHHMVGSFDDSPTVEEFAKRLDFVCNRCKLNFFWGQFVEIICIFWDDFQMWSIDGGN